MIHHIARNMSPDSRRRHLNAHEPQDASLDLNFEGSPFKGSRCSYHDPPF